MKSQIPPDELLDRAVAATRDEPIDPETLRAATERVGRRLQAAAADGSEAHRIHGCEGFRELLPAWLAGALAEPKRLLLEDHLRECVPCRRARRELERGASARPSVEAARTRRRLPLALAAGLAAAAVGTVGIWLALGGAIAPPRAELRSLEGEIFALDGGHARPLAAGAVLEEGRTVRTGAGSRAVFELADGSRIEMAPRSELELGRRHDGVVLDLGRGSVIVEAAKQERGHLYLRTEDCLVSVVGTIFNVDHGVRGSRVSVLEGEVRVRHGAELAVLKPGDQLATSTRLDRVPLETEFAWSRNAPEYRERLRALAELGRELDRLFAAPVPRTSTRLLDAAPADTLIYVAVPNLSDTLAEAWDTVEQRVDENPALAGWWRERFGGDRERGAEIRSALEELRRFGARLGPEVVIALGRGGSGEPGEPVLLAEIADRSGFEAFLDDEIAHLNAESGDGERIRRVESPSVGGEFRGLTVWIAPGDLLVATPSTARLAAIATGGFESSPFHVRLREAYAGGAEWLLGVDAGTIFEQSVTDEREASAFDKVGLSDVQYLVVESRSVDGETIHRARLSFRDERRGVASWLAEPAGSGAIEFVSPQASVAVAGLLKRPAEMLDDLLDLASLDGERPLEKLGEAEAELGISLRDDLAASLGGDFALAVDGPWLPTPAWKAVVEVVDPGRFEFALDRLVEAVNRHAQEGGHPELVWSEEALGGRVYRRLATAEGKVLFEATLVDGYFVAAPSRQLVADAIARRAAGISLTGSEAFLERLPRDAEPDFSALAWQNLGGVAGDVARFFGESNHGPGALAVSSVAGPTLALAYGGRDEVSFLAAGARGPLGLSFESLLGLAGALSPSAGESVDFAPATREETPARPAA